MTDQVIKKSKQGGKYTFAYAGFFIRLVAFLIDMLIISSINKILNGLLFSKIDIKILGFDLVAITSLIICLSYFTLMTYFNSGKTLGKQICGLKVVSTTEDKLTFSQIFIREVCGRYVQNKFYILYLLVGINPEKLSFVDMLVDTAVVKEDIYHALYEGDF